MLVIGMALMAKPKLLLLDEPSLGLAPTIVEAVYKSIAELASEGVTIVLVEQMATLALRFVDRGILLNLGHVVASGGPAELEEELEAAYLG